MTKEEAGHEKAIGKGQGPGGMDLLDWFAGMALGTGEISSAGAYNAARAMMTDRNIAHEKLRKQAEGK